MNEEVIYHPDPHVEPEELIDNVDMIFSVRLCNAIAQIEFRNQVLDKKP